MAKIRVNIDVDRAWDLYLSGMTMDEVGKELKCSHNTIRNRFKAAGFKVRPAHSLGKKGIKTEVIVSLFRSGESMAAIGKNFKVHPSTIRKRLENAGVIPPNQVKPKKQKKAKAPAPPRRICSREGCKNRVPRRPVNGVHLTRLCAWCYRHGEQERAEWSMPKAS